MTILHVYIMRTDHFYNPQCPSFLLSLSIFLVPYKSLSHILVYSFCFPQHLQHAVGTSISSCSLSQENSTETFPETLLNLFTSLPNTLLSSCWYNVYGDPFIDDSANIVSSFIFLIDLVRILSLFF